MKIKNKRRTKKDRVKYRAKHGKKNRGNYHYYASCHNKLRRSEEEAKEISKDIETMNAYKCKYCDYWHVGRNKKYKGGSNGLGEGTKAGS